MAYDQKITNALVAWLNADHQDEDIIRKGALLLLQVNRNRGLYERIIRNPKRAVAKLEYEIRKHVNLRLEGFTIEDVVKMDKEISPKIDAAISAVKDSELPQEQEEGIITVKSGMRPDHDSLPEEIKAIWPANAERWKKIKATFELLKTLNAPCDRFEHLKLLKETWYKYKKEMERYDNFSGTMDESVTVVKGNGLTEEQQRDVDYAQSYISRYLPVLLDLVESAKEPDFQDAEKLEEKRAFVQNRVNILLQNGVILSDQRKADLQKCDISIELPADAEGEKSE